MKQIETLVADIEKLFLEPHTFDEKNVFEFGQNVAKIIADRINPVKNSTRGLRMSSVGTECDRKLWLQVNKPDTGEQLPFEARMKFLFGDILEALLLFLSVEAGHTVTGSQDELSLAGVLGHRDAVIDGVTVDCKSASSYSYKKFKNHLRSEDDSFGYLKQLNAYLEAGQNDELVLDKKRAAFLVIDKTLGHVCLDIHDKLPISMEKFIQFKQVMVNSPTLPQRRYLDEPEGKSGNRKLGMQCSYCGFKDFCWPGLRTFYYSRGPVHLTKVLREPKVKTEEDSEEVGTE